MKNKNFKWQHETANELPKCDNNYLTEFGITHFCWAFKTWEIWTEKYGFEGVKPKYWNEIKL